MAPTRSQNGPETRLSRLRKIEKIMKWLRDSEARTTPINRRQLLLLGQAFPGMSRAIRFQDFLILLEHKYTYQPDRSGRWDPVRPVKIRVFFLLSGHPRFLINKPYHLFFVLLCPRSSHLPLFSKYVLLCHSYYLRTPFVLFVLYTYIFETSYFLWCAVLSYTVRQHLPRTLIFRG